MKSIHFHDKQEGIFKIHLANKDQLKTVLDCLAIIFATMIFANGVAFAQYDVSPAHTMITLNPIPSSMPSGHSLTFLGNLMTSSKVPIPNKTICIQYDSPYQATRTLAIATTDINGNFVITWKAIPKHLQSGGTYFIFANFYGDDKYWYSYSKTFPLTVPAPQV